MRGEERKQENLFHYFSVESRIPADHPIRALRVVCDEALGRLSDVFDAMYSETGRPSVPPELLLKSTILMALYSVRSEALFCEQLDYNILYRWFLGMDMSAPSFDRSTFGKNRQRLLDHEVGKEFLVVVVEIARERHLISSEHFTVDGTLIESWASLKSFKPKGEDRDDDGDSNGFKPSNPDVDFHGQKRSNATHESTTDPESRLTRKGKGKESKLAYCANVLTENRNGFVIGSEVVTATGKSECEGALRLLDRAVEDGFEPRTVGADKGYHNAGFVAGVRARYILPHVAPISGRNVEGLDRRTTRHESYAASQRKRKLVEQCFGYAKSVAGLRKSRLIGKAATELMLDVVFATLNMLRIAKLSTA